MGFLWYRYAGGWISLVQSSLAVTTRNGSSLGLTPCSTQTWQRRELAALTQNFFVFYIFRPETEHGTLALILWFHIIFFFF